MPAEIVDFLASKLLLAVVINVAFIVLFVIVFVLLIETKKTNIYTALKFRQHLLAHSFAIYIFTIFPTYLSFFIWLLAFVLLREVIFKKDAIRKQHLYSKYSKHSNSPFPAVTKLSQFKDTFFSVKGKTLRHKDFKYPFRTYSDSCLLLLAFNYFGVAEGARSVNILYFVETLIMLSIIFLFLGKFLYFISSKTRKTSISISVSPRVLLFLIGIIYYSVLIAILFKTYGFQLLTI